MRSKRLRSTSPRTALNGRRPPTADAAGRPLHFQLLEERRVLATLVWQSGDFIATALVDFTDPELGSQTEAGTFTPTRPLDFYIPEIESGPNTTGVSASVYRRVTGAPSAGDATLGLYRIWLDAEAATSDPPLDPPTSASYSINATITYKITGIHPNEQLGDPLKFTIDHLLGFGASPLSGSASQSFSYSLTLGGEEVVPTVSDEVVPTGDPPMGHSQNGSATVEAQIGDELVFNLSAVGNASSGGKLSTFVALGWENVTVNLRPDPEDPFEIDHETRRVRFTYEVQNEALPPEAGALVKAYWGKPVVEEGDDPELVFIQQYELPATTMGKHSMHIPFDDLGFVPKDYTQLVLVLDSEDVVSERSEFDNDSSYGFIPSHLIGFVENSPSQLDEVKLIYEIAAFPPGESFKLSFFAIPDLDFEELGLVVGDRDTYLEVFRAITPIDIAFQIDVSEASLIANSSFLRLEGEDPEDALAGGPHRLIIDTTHASAAPLAAALQNSDFEVIIAQANFHPAETPEITQFTIAPFNGFYQAAPASPLVVRTSLGYQDDVEITQSGGTITVDATGHKITRPASAQPSILVMTVDNDDRIDVAPSVAIRVEVHSGIGHDTVQGGGGDDVLYGGFGIDLIRGGAGDDWIDGEAGDDKPWQDDDEDDRPGGLYGEGGNDFIIGDLGEDALFGGDDDDVLLGDGYELELSELPTLGLILKSFLKEYGEDDPTLVEFSLDLVPLEGFRNLIDGQGGNDLMVGGQIDDELHGGPGNALILGDPFTFEFDVEVDVEVDVGDLFTDPKAAIDFYGSMGFENGGGDEVYGDKSGVFIVLAGPGNDVIHGVSKQDINDEDTTDDDGFDVLFGNDGDDEIHGYGGLNFIVGGDGSETLITAGEYGESLGVNVVIGDRIELTPAAAEGLDVQSLFGDDTFYIPGGFLQMFQQGVDGAGDDTIELLDGISLVLGGPGNDFIGGAGGSESWNLLFGQDGEDTIQGYAGANFIFGGEDSDPHLGGGEGFNFIVGGWLGLDSDVDLDTPNSFVGALEFIETLVAGVTVEGTDGDNFVGGSGVNVILGGSGDDDMTGGDHPEALDLLMGFDGTDTIDGKAGFNVIIGGRGGDPLLQGGNNGNVIIGDHLEISGFSIDFDRLLEFKILEAFKAPSFEIVGNAETDGDVIKGGEGFDFIVGGPGRDDIEGGDGLNVVFGDKLELQVGGLLGVGWEIATSTAKIAATPLGSGKAAFEALFNFFKALFDLFGASENEDYRDIYVGGKDIDIVFGGDGPDRLEGGAGKDFMVGGRGTDYFKTNPGEPFVKDGWVDDFAFGGPGDDVFEGGDGDDFLASTEGDDVFYGNAGDDVIFAGDGADTLDGGEGDDLLFGEGGDDILDGGPGNNLVVQDFFDFPDPAGDYDRDGDVDGADFLLWQRNLGQAVAAHGDGADGDLDQTIDAGDLAVWSSNYGAIAESAGVVAAAAVAAPSSASFYALGGAHLQLTATPHAEPAARGRRPKEHGPVEQPIIETSTVAHETPRLLQGAERRDMRPRWKRSDQSRTAALDEALASIDRRLT